jgi:hypothetical protein
MIIIMWAYWREILKKKNDIPEKLKTAIEIIIIYQTVGEIKA